MDSNAYRAGEVERKVWRDNDSFRAVSFSKAAARCRPARCVNPAKARANGAVPLLALEQLRSEMAPTTLVLLRIVELRSRLVSADVPR